MHLTALPKNQRPREKLLSQGATSLTDAELLAIFLRTGIPGCNAIELAEILLTEFGSLRGLFAAEQTQFCLGKGLGLAKYVQLQAVLELSKRFFHEQLQSAPVFNAPQAVRQYLHHRLANQHYEEFMALLLDNQHRLLKALSLFQGTIDGAAVYPRVVVEKVLQHGAAAVIFAHNHPSGVAEPSNADRLITDKLQQALAIIDVPVLDHLVIGQGQYCSFAERGWL